MNQFLSLPFLLRSRLFAAAKVPLIMVFLCCSGLLKAQQAYSPQVSAALHTAYDHLKQPEISFEEFARINAHVYINANINATQAVQDTYCGKVRLYCNNGDFESGLDQNQYTGAYGTWAYPGQAINLYPDPFALTYGFASGVLNSSSAHQTIVNKSAGNDPTTGISVVPSNGGNQSLRLGNNVNGYGTEILAKTVVVNSLETILNFYYAVVFEDPGHPRVDQPAFSVRVYDCATGSELPNVCNLGNNSNIAVSDAANPFFKSLNNGAIAYRDWSLAQINLSAYVGKTVIIVFTNKDCGQGGHWGYTYLDNLFSDQCPLVGPPPTITTGDINLDTSHTSTCGNGSICVKYKLPYTVSSNVTTYGYDTIVLDIYQNGSLVNTLTSPQISTYSSDSTYCFNINPSALGLNTSLGGFDYSITGKFTLGVPLASITRLNPPNGLVPGLNNDYAITCLANYYSKSTGGLHLLSTWGVNLDGSGANPSDFGAGKTFNLANRSGLYTLTNDWTVGGLIVNPTGSQLQLNNFTLSEAGLSGGGTLTGTLTSSLMVTGTSGGDAGTLNFTPGDGNLFRLTLNRTGTSASVSIGAQPLSLYNTLTITNGTLNTNNLLILKSNAANTARVNAITGAISGSVTVERYIPARRAWRILCAPITGSQTINAAWQEGAATTTANPAPNFGTFITGGTVAAGFDQSPGAVSSMKTYSNTSGWVPIANTNTTAVNAAAYMTFVYGNRNSVTIPVDQVPGNTTLRSFGPLKVGDQTFAVAATGFTAVPNPFASPINFATLTRTGVTNTFYLWDPKIGGTYGVGGYVTVSFNGTTYDVSTNAISPESQFIQSGQGFLVFPSTSGTAGSITIKESDKFNIAEADVFRTAGGSGNSGGNSTAPVFQDPTKGQGLRLSLQLANADRTYTTLDEAFSSFSARYSNQLDELDAVKPANIAENLGFATGKEQSLSIERRQVPVAGEEMALKLWNTTERSYVLSINPVNLSATGLYAFLKDKYLGTCSAVSLKEVTQVPFSINSSAASARSDRFSVVFSRSDKLPQAVSTSPLIRAYPNPVTGRNLSLQFSNQPAGSYRVAVLSSTGSTVLEQKVQHVGGTAVVAMTLDKKLLPGTYQLQVSGSSTKSSVQLVVQ